jgi:hypothetical protein
MLKSTRKNIEAQCLLLFDAVISDLGLACCRGYGAANRFDPGFGLIGQQRFQYGDLRVDLPDRVVIVEVESGGGATNLVKYWPLASSLDRPHLLLHGFGQGSRNDYVSHLHLWDFLWSKMREEIWSAPNPRLFARRFQYTSGSDTELAEAAQLFRECLTLPLEQVLVTVFDHRKVEEPAGAESIRT